MLTLRPYQSQAIQSTRESIASGHRAPIIVAPTGAGKTVIASEIIRGAESKSRSTLFLAHRFELVSQASMKLAYCGIEHNIIAPPDSVRQIKVDHFKEYGRSYVNHRSATDVGTIQTKSRRLNDLRKNYDMLIFDECHLSISPSYKAVRKTYSDAILIGLTATATRLDGKGLGMHCGGLYDDIIKVCTPQQLIDEGFLVPYKFYGAEHTPDVSGVRKKGGDYDGEQLGKIMEKPKIIGDAVDHYTRIARGRVGMQFSPTVAHAERTAEYFRQAGYRAVALSGKSLSSERNRVIKDAGRGMIDMICNCGLFVEGLDQSAISCIIWLCHTMSLTKFLQGTGRGGRPHTGKDDCIVFDHVGNCGSMVNGEFIVKHGFPDDDREWSLEGVKRKKRNNDEAPVSVQRCPSCYAIHRPASHCPQCGHAYIAGAKRREIKQVEGDLVEIKRAATIKRKREERDCRTLEDFIELGKSRGYRFYEQWAQKRYAFRQARNPLPQPQTIHNTGAG